MFYTKPRLNMSASSSIKISPELNPSDIQLGSETPPAPVKVHKKRGRKPLSSKINVSNTATSVSSETQPPKLTKKKSSSSNEVVISKQTKLKKNENVVSKPIIVHLNVTPSSNVNNANVLSDLSTIENYPSSASQVAITHSDNVSNFESNFFEYTPEIDEPTGYDGNQSTTSYSCIAESPACETDCGGKKDKTSKTKGKNILMKDFVSNEEWTERTHYWCYWDCHPFDTTPFGIPIKYKNNKFHVFGCFCSLECATAYNFYNLNQNIDNAWENYNLINMLSNDISYKTSVNPAIDRRCLQAFGGNLTIEDFRHLSQSNTTYNVLSFPMVSVVEHVEEVTDVNSNSNPSSSMIPNITNSSYFPLNKSIINKLESTNTSNIKSTLETSMNMTFSV